MIPRIFSPGWDDYALIDFGNGKKLERWGNVHTLRPDIQACSKPDLSEREWQYLSDWEFIETDSQNGIWQARKADAPEQWQIGYGRLRFQLKVTRFKHVGLFPEQRSNWDFIAQHLPATGRFLNLFAYTGAASCVARQTGAETRHVDSVKPLLNWAHANMLNSALQDIKWIREDALKFVEREVKRGKIYDGLVMDPPAWGLGAKGERWKIEDKLDTLVAGAANLLNSGGFLILNTYSPSIDPPTMMDLVRQYFPSTSNKVAELCLQSNTNRPLYTGLVLRAFKS